MRTAVSQSGFWLRRRMSSGSRVEIQDPGGSIGDLSVTMIATLRGDALRTRLQQARSDPIRKRRFADST
jgi:hypothetical protein